MQVTAVVEMPAFSYYKYEAKNGDLVIDRALSIMNPYAYGYITDTLSPDGDNLDCFILASAQLYPLVVCKVKIIGAFKCLDQGVQDDKLLCMLDDGGAWDLEDVKSRIIHYLNKYKVGFNYVSYIQEKDAIVVYEDSKI